MGAVIDRGPMIYLPKDMNPPGRLWTPGNESSSPTATPDANRGEPLQIHPNRAQRRRIERMMKKQSKLQKIPILAAPKQAVG